MPPPISVSAAGVDLSKRIVESHTVVGSPATAAETIVVSVTLPKDLAITYGVFLEAFVAFTVGTSGTAGRFRIRQTDTSGTIIADTGALTMAAGNLVAPGAQGVDQAPSLAGQVYVGTLTITAGAATSTVSSVSLFATIV